MKYKYRARGLKSDNGTQYLTYKNDKWFLAGELGRLTKYQKIHEKDFYTFISDHPWLSEVFSKEVINDELYTFSN